MIPGLLGALSGGFRPLDIAGCVLWLDARQLVGLSNNDPVATWTDLSGAGRHFTQSTESKRPLFKTNQHITRPAVVFDGIDDSLGGAALILRPMVQYAVLSSVNDYAVPLDTEFNSFRPSCYRDPVLNVAKIYSNTEFSGTTTWASSEFAILTAVFGLDGKGSLFLNGKTEVDNQAIGSSDYPGPLQIGAFTDSNWYDTHLGELLVYASANRNLSIERYLAQEWDITIDQSPVNTVLPSISAASWTVDQPVTCDPGTWTNTPTSYAYQWQSKDGGYTDIPGATSSIYVTTAYDQGKYVRCGVVPSNAFATGTVAYSADSDVIL